MEASHVRDVVGAGDVGGQIRVIKAIRTLEGSRLVRCRTFNILDAV